MMQPYECVWDIDPKNEIKNNIAFIVNSFGIPLRTLEIGSYYGLTTMWLVETLGPLCPDLAHYCIDPYTTSMDVGENLTDVYAAFQRNIKKNPYGHLINHLRMRSYDGLLKLRADNIRPQLIFIDGDHTAPVVLEDLVLSFELLETGGVIICDDSVDWVYQGDTPVPAAQMSPRMAVEMFVACNWHRLKPIVLPHGHQTAFVKRVE